MSAYRGRSALVVGGSQGIGLAIAAELVRRGAEVTVASRSQEKLDAARAAIGAETEAFDVTDFDATRAVIDRLCARRVPDLVVCCAGFARPGWIADLDVAHYRDMIEVNYLGSVHVAKAVLPHFTARGSGHLVLTSSLAGFMGLFGYTGYCASKYAVIGFAEALRREVRPLGVDVSVLCPPNTRTPGLEAENRHKPSQVLATEQRVAVVEPERVARHLLDAMPRRRFLVIPTLDGRAAHWLSRFAPWALDRLLRRP